MADDPVVIDDGGSTRIKKLRNPESGNSLGEMDTLMDVKHDRPEPGKSTSENTTNFRNRGYGERVTVSFVNSSGVAATAPGFPVDNFKFVKIVSGDETIQHTIVGEAQTDGKLHIAITGHRLNPPIVDARQHELQRRYIVTNAASIISVEVTPASGPVVVFDASTKLPDGRKAVHYTSVAIT